MKPIVKRSILIVVWAITLITLFYAVENWRGAHTYVKAKQRYLNSGCSISLSEILPETVPDRDNALASLRSVTTTIPHPLWHREPPFPNTIRLPNQRLEDYRQQRKEKQLERARRQQIAESMQRQLERVIWRSKNAPLSPAQWNQTARWFREVKQWVPIDLVEAPPAEQVLAAMEEFDSWTTPLVESANRPGAQFPKSEESSAWMQLIRPLHAGQIRVAIALGIQTSAAAHERRESDAFQYMLALTRLWQATQNAPFNPVQGREAERFSWIALRHLLAHGLLTEPHWRQIQECWGAPSIRNEFHRQHALWKLAMLEWCEQFKRSSGAQIAWQIDQWKSRRRTGPWFIPYLLKHELPNPIAAAAIPSGWWDHDKALILDQPFGVWREGCLDDTWLARQGLDVAVFGAIDGGMNMLAKEIWQSLAVTAIAIERYRLTHRHLPTSLQELIPTFLKARHSSMRYQCLDPRRYALTVDHGEEIDGRLVQVPRAEWEQLILEE